MMTRQICTCIGLSINSEVRMSMIPHTPDQAATLVIGRSVCEAFDKPSLERLRDLADDALRELRGFPSDAAIRPYCPTDTRGDDG